MSLLFMDATKRQNRRLPDFWSGSVSMRSSSMNKAIADELLSKSSKITRRSNSQSSFLLRTTLEDLRRSPSRLTNTVRVKTSYSRWDTFSDELVVAACFLLKWELSISLQITPASFTQIWTVAAHGKANLCGN